MKLFEFQPNAEVLPWAEKPNFFKGIKLSGYARGTVVSWQGRYLLITGEQDGYVRAFLNMGSEGSPAWKEQTDFFRGVSKTLHASTTVFDLDGDGVWELVVGDVDGNVTAYRMDNAQLDDRSVAETQKLQVALGKIRRVSGHFPGKLLLIDPHRAPSYSHRHMRKRQIQRGAKPIKTGQTFFCLDGDSRQPLCFTSANSARTVSQATPELLRLAAEIFGPLGEAHPLVAADTEHFAVELIDHVHQETAFDLIVPMPKRQTDQRRWRQIPAEAFTHHWAGYATAIRPYTSHHSRGGPYYELVQRLGSARSAR